ncbi:type 1 glutamine amidotransferase [Dictyobacter kobayashii]|uniref:Glutamine amidotransferase domain-containing protein n=1 Tax=Dictyobacter kobayashii TaxID=2014872 RepID=A0A402AB34_9CHLR|nr:type 1 glutamine amidotransferase [Dictyobacter kobayashii]GCE16383.1 hypothetical protein KDK_01830 [Dictyobacter kobayashii]
MGNQRVLLLQHVQINPPGLVGEVLRQHQVPYDIVQVASEHLPDLTPYNAIVSFGGTQHVYEENESRYRYLREEELLLRHAVEQQIPILGICLGSQILAHAFGGNVHPQPPIEIGFLRVHLSEKGQHDPLFQGFQDYEQAFQWHEDIFDPPPGATVLASHSSGKHHVFKIGFPCLWFATSC